MTWQLRGNAAVARTWVWGQFRSVCLSKGFVQSALKRKPWLAKKEDMPIINKHPVYLPGQLRVIHLLMKALLRSKLLLGACRHAVSTHAALGEAQRHQHSHQRVPAALHTSRVAHSAHLTSSPLNTKKYNWIHYFLFYDLFRCGFNLSCKRWGRQAVPLPWIPTSSSSPRLPYSEPGSGFYEARVSGVVGAVSTANQLLKVATAVPCKGR